ncbi:hypothetical protein BIV57_18745 [Mangrovactinospora gilvigrisea]|uniref:Uncharacterized protein n=1 Tax=Mangrovactinospora gilvigrisea TaxID=1428644 RepID=A0A1J7BB99_9ACTN|nr:hypothetical protein [Mangrovactinospora gilvigrisea]OIV35959.1 hypothetical protein BIV57_18745 [Mangrovactinospora gilvigrisea]
MTVDVPEPDPFDPFFDPFADTAAGDPASSPAPRVRTLIVGPRQATNWLAAHNAVQRPLREKVVAAYARDMAAGHWRLNGDTIKLCVHGDVLDGRHRLAAVARAQASVPVMLVENLPDSAQESVDCGSRRSAGDVLALHGEQRPHLLAAALRLLWRWEVGDLRLTGHAPTTAEVLQLLAARPTMRDSIEAAHQTHAAFPYPQASVLALAHHLFAFRDADAATVFLEQLASGTGLPDGHPVLALRRALVRAASTGNGSQSRTWKLAVLIRAWNAGRAGQPLHRLSYLAGSQMPLPR